MEKKNLVLFNLLLLVIFSLLIGNVSAGVDNSFNYVIKGAGTQDNNIYPDQDFTWTLTTDWKEEYYLDEEFLELAKYFSSSGYQVSNTYYIDAPPDTKITSFRIQYPFSVNGGYDSGTYIDTTNNRVVVKQYSGGYKRSYSCGFFSTCYTYYSGHYSAYYYIYGKKLTNATITNTTSGSGVVNALENTKFIRFFSDNPPQPQHGGSITGPIKRTIESDNPKVSAIIPWIIILNGINVYAKTDYYETNRVLWENTEGGSSTVNVNEGEKLIISSSLIAPNEDTQWSVTDDNPDVETWMIGEKLYAKVRGLNSGPTNVPEFPTIALPIISVIGLLFVMRRKK